VRPIAFTKRKSSGCLSNDRHFKQVLCYGVSNTIFFICIGRETKNKEIKTRASEN